jgi:UDP-N-acetylglucosamine 2-epimerase (non-hydrolysing)
MTEEKPTALFIFGTRPEAIKLAPVIHAFRHCVELDTRVCVTGQHRQMLDQVLDFFGIKSDFDLKLMTHNQSLPGLAAKAIAGCSEIFEQLKPGMVFVQGDTTTAFAAAFAAFLHKIPVAHVEAGLRSFQKYSPFPEEANRIMISHLGDLHFAPTQGAADNLKREGVERGVFVVGNTVVDALLLGLELLRTRGEEACREALAGVDFSKALVLITVHRRESFGEPLADIFGAIRELALARPDAELVYPVHLNPNVREQAFRILQGVGNIHLLEPLPYAPFIWAMSKAALIITDSGGVQEEAPSLGVEVLVVRNVTERGEGVEAGCAKIVGSDRKRIVSEALRALDQAADRKRVTTNPYGDGKAAGRILERTLELLRKDQK